MSATMPPRGRFIIALAVLVGTLYVPLWSLLASGVEAPFRYFAADAFYYLAIAKHSVGRAIFTYDGVTPTTGFNPLWMYYLSQAFGAAPADQNWQLIFTFVSSASFTAIGTACFAAALYTIAPRPLLAIVATVPGFYYIAFSPLDPHVGTAWAFINGMETSLSVLFFGVLVYVIVARNLLGSITIGRAALMSALVTAITLSRLDDVFLFAPVFALISLRAPADRRVRCLVVAASIPTAVLGFYLLHNYRLVGFALPISGVAKSEGLLNPLAWINTFREFVRVFVPPAVDQRPWAWSGRALRVMQLFAPVICAAIWLYAGARAHDGWQQFVRTSSHARLFILLVVLLYLPLKAGYNLLYVHLWNQGHWYYPLSIMMTNLMLLMFIDGYVAPPAVNGSARQRSLRLFAATGVAMYIALAGNAFLQLKHYSTYGADFYHFWRNRAAITERLNDLEPSGGILEFDDGIVSFALDRHTMSGTSLAGDAEVLAASRAGDLLQHAYDRGVRLIASVWYMQDWPQNVFSDQAAFNVAVGNLVWGQNTKPWRLTPLLHEQRPEFHYVIIRLEPADGSSGTRDGP